MTEFNPDTELESKKSKVGDLMKSFLERHEFEPAIPSEQTTIIATTYFPGFDGEDTGVSDNVRGLLALESIKKFNQKGVNVCIVDGGSSKLFNQKIKEINSRRFYDSVGGVATLDDFVTSLEVAEECHQKKQKYPGNIWLINQEKKGYSNARIEAVKNITDVTTGFINHGVVVQMEIEKVELVDEIEKLTQAITKEGADIAIPDRGIRVKELGDDEDNFCNYPEFQAISERKANIEIHKQLVAAGIRKKEDPILDLFGGTRAIKDEPDVRKLFGEIFKIPEDSPLWGKVKPEIYSNAVYFPVYLALALGKNVASVPINFSYPSIQSELEKKDENFAVKRQRQFDDIVTGSELLIEFLGKKTKNLKLANKFIDQELILKSLRKDAATDLKELKWTNENDFSAEKYYQTSDTLSRIDMAIDGNQVIKHLEEALDSYYSNFDYETSFLGWDSLTKVEKIMSSIRFGVKLFWKTNEAQEIYKKYQDKAANFLYNSTLMFHILRDSDASRNLDIASFMAKSVELPDIDYTVAVLYGTPDSATLTEFKELSKEFKFSAKEKEQVIIDLSRIILQKRKDKSDLTGFNRLMSTFQLTPDQIEKIRKELQASGIVI